MVRRPTTSSDGRAPAGDGRAGAPDRSQPGDDAEAGDASERRDRILAAAVAEFAAHGLSGARVDRIAERAGANKQLIYYYFGDKAGLFDAAVRVMAQRFERVRATLPADLGERLVAYFDGATSDRDIIRMLQWEALEVDAGAYVSADTRREHMRTAVDQLAAERRSGRIPADLDPAQLFLSFQALAAHPYAFPQMTEFITGHHPDDPVFRRERRTFLRRLGAHLSTAGAEISHATDGSPRRRGR